MNAIPGGIRAESGRNPVHVPQDSGLNAASQPASQPLPHPSRSMALALVIESLRPDWTLTDIQRALAADDRPWAVLAPAAIRACLDHGIRHPNGLRHVNPGGYAATPTPPGIADLVRAGLLPPRPQED